MFSNHPPANAWAKVFPRDSQRFAMLFPNFFDRLLTGCFSPDCPIIGAKDPAKGLQHDLEENAIICNLLDFARNKVHTSRQFQVCKWCQKTLQPM